jgi:hypothetical protein
MIASAAISSMKKMTRRPIRFIGLRRVGVLWRAISVDRVSQENADAEKETQCR